jgi:RNA polymerase sigma-70 factor, ECF subfamily
MQGDEFAPKADGIESEPSSDAELITRLRDDPTALADLYDRYGRLVFGIAKRTLGNIEEAQDLTQEVFLNLQTQRSYDPARGSLAAYLTTVTRTRAIDLLRFRTRRVTLLHRFWSRQPEPEPEWSALDLLNLEECAARVRTALAALSDNERIVLELAYFSGLSQSEIAEQLGAPLGSVKSWARRGLLGLRDQLADLLE